jgi:hypothetical protein
MLNAGNQVHNFIQYCTFARTFVIPFYHGSGSATAKSYGSYGSGSTTLVPPRFVKIIESGSVS